MNATYVGVATHAWFAALRSAVAARHDNERVLELDPKYVDAKVAIGTDLYIVGSLSWPVKVAASVAGLSGNKQKGLEYLREAASSKHVEVATDAKIILALFLRREQRYAEALQVVNDMQNQYPRNFLMATEYAHLLNAAGHGQDAIAAYRKVLAGCHNNAYVSAARSRLPPTAWANRCVVKSNISRPHRPMNWPPAAAKIPNCGKELPWLRVRCMTSCRSGIPLWKNTRL